MPKRQLLLIALLLSGLGFGVWDPFRFREPWHRGMPISSWLTAYGDGPRNYQPSAAADEALRQIGTNAVPFLLRQLHSTHCNSRVKSSSLPTARQMPGAWNTTNVSARIRLMIWVEGHSSIHFHPLRPPASWDHWQAYLGFQALGSLGKAAIPHLVKLARDPSGNSYMGNVQGMKDIGLVAKLADNSSTYVIAGESPMMGNRSVGTNTFFVTTGRMRATNSYLVDGDIAACSLAAIGTDAVPSLTEMLADPNPRLKERAALALGMTGDAAESAVPGLINCLSHPNVMVRIVAADALGWINQKPDLTVPALTQSLNDPEIGVKCWAADSLGRFRERATNAIPVLLASFAARDYRIRGSAAVALSKISQDTTAKEVVPVLLQQYNQSDSSLRSGAIRDLGQLHMLPEVLIPVFTAALDDSDDLVRMNAIHALEWFGPKAKASVPKLLSLKTDRNPFVCEYAVRALEKINPQP